MKDDSHLQAYLLHRAVPIYLLKYSPICFSSTDSAALCRSTTIDIFGGSLDAVADIVDEMESNPDAFTDAIGTE